MSSSLEQLKATGTTVVCDSGKFLTPLGIAGIPENLIADMDIFLGDFASKYLYSDSSRALSTLVKVSTELHRDASATRH